MVTEKMEFMYQKIANTLNNMIPEEWGKILLYAEFRDGFSQVYFYYYPAGSHNAIYSLDITDVFDLDSKAFKKMKQDLYQSFEELWIEFKKQGQEPWTNLTFILDHSGKMKINYGYEDISQISAVEKQEKWEAEYLK